MDDFLKVEYEQCIGLIKYYDERQVSLLKYSAGLSSVVASIVLGLGEGGIGLPVASWRTTLLASVASLSLAMLFLAMVQNRLYFLFPARQANALRRTFLMKASTRFPSSSNRMYLDSDFDAFQPRSAQALMGVLVAGQVGVFVVLTAMSLLVRFRGHDEWTIVTALASGLVFTIVLLWASASYLKTRSKMGPDESVHMVQAGGEASANGAQRGGDAESA
jgi:hypothetical protein